MHHIKTVTVLATLLLLMVGFTGCVGSENDVDAIKTTAQEISDSSTLPMELLTPHSDVDEGDYEDYISNFMSFDYYGKDFRISFSGFPTDENDFFLTDITWTGIDYDLFGVKVGDHPNLALDKLKSWGWVHTDGSYTKIFEKDGIALKVTGGEKIEEISIHIPTKYTSGNLY
jgi:hypothetical protein